MISETVPTTRPWLRAPFLIATVILICVAIAVPLSAKFGKHFQKAALDLRVPLHKMPQDAFEPRYSFDSSSILPPTVVDALGTSEYLSWTLEDRKAARNSNTRFVNLSITYYRTPDKVPHTPDVCMVGAGYQLIDADTIEMTIPTLPEDIQNVPVRMVTFEKSEIQGKAKPTVLYTFRVNDSFACRRNSVRAILSDLKAVAGYYSKIELSFHGQKGFASPEESVEAAQALYSSVLPVLIQDYWPEPGAPFQEVNKADIDKK